MNRLQNTVLEALVSKQVKSAEYIPIALYEALDTADSIIVEDILDLLDRGAYVAPDEMALSVDSIDTILRYGRDKSLTMEFGFGSILESYIVSMLSELLGADLLECM